jgi:16S rRNA G966 N2-methylase RsmD
VAGDVERVIPRLADRGPFDLVLVDPPWADVAAGGIARSLDGFMRAGLAADGAWVVLEHASRDAAPDVGGLARGQTRTYGDSALTFYKTGIL